MYLCDIHNTESQKTYSRMHISVHIRSINFYILKKNTFLLKKAKRRLREINLITHLKYKQHNYIYKQETGSGCSSTHQGHLVARCKRIIHCQSSAERTTTRISMSFLPFFGLVYYNGYFVSMWVSCQHRPSIMSTNESDTKTVVIMLVKTL